MSSRTKPFILLILLAMTMLACRLESYVQTPTLPTPYVLMLTPPPPTLTPIPTVSQWNR